MEFRTLRADEIECRVSTVSQKGCSLLLYKDARADMNLLDEVVGAENWQRKHEVVNGNLFCNVGIKIGSELVWKQDVGVESYTEKEKGEASDSFKRACVNWGIGRELYTAPFIWVNAGDCNIADKNGKPTTYDRFTVLSIDYDDKRNISFLKIRNEKLRRVVYVYSHGEPDQEAGEPSNMTTGGQKPETQGNKPPQRGRGQRGAQSAADAQANEELARRANATVIDAAKVKVLRDKIKRKGVSEKSVLAKYGLSSFNTMLMEQWSNAIALLDRYADKEVGA